MSVLWCGGEDIDFPNGTVDVSTNGAYFRSGMARCAICGALGTNAGYAKSNPFVGGTVSSGWLSWRMYVSDGGGNTSPCIGLGHSGVGHDGIFLSIGGGNNDMSKASLLTISGTNGSQTLGTTQSGSIPAHNAPVRFDLQFINYGANGTLNLYANGSLVLTYTGNIAVPEIADGFDSVIVGPAALNGTPLHSSEIIVADEPTLGWQGLVTCAPNGNGSVQQWQNPADTNYNEVVITDANSAYTNVVGQDEQATLIPVPAGNFAIKAVRVVARANGPSGSVPTGIELGFSNGINTVVGAKHTITDAFAPYEDMFATDPITGQPWTDLTGYQIDMRSA